MFVCDRGALGCGGDRRENDMAHGDPLTDEEYSVKVNRELIRYIEAERARLGLERDRMRVLDWGTGRGVHLLHLMEMGYTRIQGVDVNPAAIERGREFFANRGLNIDDYLSLLNESGRCQFPDASFDFVFSVRVFEHVRDIETTVSEIGRVSAPGAGGFHIFPAHHIPVEGHLHMPLVHWLPKNGARRALINAWKAVGVEPEWQWNNGQPRDVRAKRYNEFSVKSTYYRSYGEVRRVFQRHGLRVNFVCIDHPAIKRSALGKLTAAGPLRAAVNRAVLNFWAIEFTTLKG